MKSQIPQDPKQLRNNHALLEALMYLLSKERYLTVGVLKYLAEVDKRKLYRDQGCSSMFTFCLQRLGFSEAQTHVRLSAARAGRRYPVVFDYIQAGKLHLTGVAMLAKHLTAQNHNELLAKAIGKSKRQLEKLIATWFPQPDAAEKIREIPKKAKTQQILLSQPAKSQEPKCPSRPTEAEPSITNDKQKTQRPSQSTLAPPPPQSTVPIAAASFSIKPTSEKSYQIQFKGSENLVKNINRAKNLLGFKRKGNDLGAIFEKALEQYVDNLEKQRLGKKRSSAGKKAQPKKDAIKTPSQQNQARANQGSAPKAQPDFEQLEAGAVISSPAPKAEPDSAKARSQKSKSRYIPKAVRRLVFERDQGQCQFVDAQGRRCTEKFSIEFHHVIPFAKGGPASAQNIQLRCSAHNALEAERDFGPQFMRNASQQAQGHLL
jgi:hypothetical protein